MNDVTVRVVDLQKRAIGEVLTFAEVALSPHQFRAFKKLVFELFHDRLKPETIQILKGIDQVRAVPNSDSLDGKERVP